MRRCDNVKWVEVGREWIGERAPASRLARSRIGKVAKDEIDAMEIVGSFPRLSLAAASSSATPPPPGAAALGWEGDGADAPKVKFETKALISLSRAFGVTWEAH